MLEAIAYVIVCLFTGLCDIDRRMGFAGTFLIVLIAAALAALTGPSRRIEWRRRA
jgi:hypothetical protein